MNTDPARDEVWLADLGMQGKTRPVLVLAHPEPDDARLASLSKESRGTIQGLQQALSPDILPCS